MGGGEGEGFQWRGVVLCFDSCFFCQWFDFNGLLSGLLEVDF